VRAGSIIPYGPAVEYVEEKPSDPTTLYIYAGADGQFTLYEDEGTTYAYEKGAFLQIPIRWDDKTSTLTIGKQTGAFDGMLSHRTFQIVLVSKAHPASFSLAPNPLKSVHYAGAEIRVKLQ
jgi:alpha-D-xyloside xylohydrolase